MLLEAQADLVTWPSSYGDVGKLGWYGIILPMLLLYITRESWSTIES